MYHNDFVYRKGTVFTGMCLSSGDGLTRTRWSYPPPSAASSSSRGRGTVSPLPWTGCRYSSPLPPLDRTGNGRAALNSNSYSSFHSTPGILLRQQFIDIPKYYKVAESTLVQICEHTCNLN